MVLQAVKALAGSTKGFRDGAGNQAKFHIPYGIHSYYDSGDSTDYVLVADFCNYKIRRVDAHSGWVTTLVGQNGYGDVDGGPSVQKLKSVSSVQVAPSKEFALISDKGSCKVKKYDFSSGELTTIAQHPKVIYPIGITMTGDSRTAYVADWGANAIKIIDMNVVPPTIATFAGGRKGYADGTGTRIKFNGLESIALSPDERYLFTTEFKNNVIRRISISTKSSITWAGRKGAFGRTDGVGTDARFSGLGEISFAPVGTFFLVPDYYNHNVRKVVVTTRSVTTVAGSGIRGNINRQDGLKARFDGPYGMTFISDSQAVCGEYDGHRLRSLCTDQAPTPAPGTTQPPTSHCNNPNVKKYFFDFSFEDGTDISGYSDDNTVNVEVDGSVFELHISCSDNFENGYGEKGGPVEGVNPRVTSFQILKFKYPGSSNCEVYKECFDRYPTVSPTKAPTDSPTIKPTPVPTVVPTEAPTPIPSVSPTRQPTKSPTPRPTSSPSPQPTPRPTTEEPTRSPVTSKPTVSGDTRAPTPEPSPRPTKVPTASPTSRPTSVPTSVPTYIPTAAPTHRPSKVPTAKPTPVPSAAPSAKPTPVPTGSPTHTPTTVPTVVPTPVPTSTVGPTLSPTGSDCRNPAVMIRLDNVESFWCNEIVVEIVEEVVALGFPINLGIIAGGENINRDSYLSEHLEEWATNPLIEIGSGSFSYDTYQGQSLTWQLDDLQHANDAIRRVTSNGTHLGDQPTSFIPPGGSFDGNTLAAMKAKGMDVMSSYCIWSLTNPGTTTWCPSGEHLVAPSIEQDDVCMLPAGAVLGDIDYWADNSGPADLFSAVSWIEMQIDQQGFSVLQLKPIEFAVEKRGCAVMDEEKKTILKELLNYGKDRWDFMKFDDAKDVVRMPQSASCPTPPPDGRITASPTVTSTATDHPTWAPVVASSSPSAKPTPEFTSAPTKPDCAYPPIVMFRLDNVQAFWCSDIAIDLVQEFLDEDVRLNVGLIGEHGMSALADDAILGAKIGDWSNEWTNIELVSNSQKFMDFEGETYSWQEADLQEAHLDIAAVANGFCPLSFIPPFGTFDHNTPPAMLAANIDVMSSYCMWDDSGNKMWCPSGGHRIPNIVENGVHMLPSGAVLGGKDYWEDNSLPADYNSTLRMVQSQIDNQGFSVISMSPYEFANDRDLCLGLNSDKIDVLRKIFRYAKKHWDVRLFQDAKTTIVNRPECTDAPTRTPTLSPTPRPTFDTNPTPYPTVYSDAPTLGPTEDGECPGNVETTYEEITRRIRGGHETRTIATTTTTLPDKTITATHETCVIVTVVTNYTDGFGAGSNEESGISSALSSGGVDNGWTFAVIFAFSTIVLFAVVIGQFVMGRQYQNWDRDTTATAKETEVAPKSDIGVSYSMYPSPEGIDDDDDISVYSDNPHQERLPGSGPSMKDVMQDLTKYQAANQEECQI